MAITADSLAAGTGVTFKNVQQKAGAEDIPRKIIVFGTPLAAKTGVVPNVPQLTLSPADTADRNGAGSMMHRLVTQVFAGSAGAVAIYEMPSTELGGSVAAVGEVDFTITPVVAAGTLHMFIGGIYVPVVVTAAMTEEVLVDACVAAITANPNLPVDGAKAAATFELDITSKSTGPWGNEILIAFNLVDGQAFPSGIAAAVTPMATGAGVPVIATALDALGTGDDANEARFTAGVHGYGQDTTILAAINTYIGPTDEAVGTYLETCKRPFYLATGDVGSGSAGLTALTVITDARVTHRGNVIIAAPGEYQPASEIAANAVGTAERFAANLSAQPYHDAVLNGITPYSVSADRWTKDHTVRETAVQAGIATTQVKGGALTIQNFISMSRPASVPVGSNVYRDIVNQVKTQNIMFNLDQNFSQSKWKQAFIVADVAKVAGNAKSGAKDIDAVKADLVTLAVAFAKKGWLYSADFTIAQLALAGSVTARQNGTGFDYAFKAIYSGSGGVTDGLVEADISLAVFTT